MQSEKKETDGKCKSAIEKTCIFVMQVWSCERRTPLVDRRVFAMKVLEGLRTEDLVPAGLLGSQPIRVQQVQLRCRAAPGKSRLMECRVDWEEVKSGTAPHPVVSVARSESEQSVHERSCDGPCARVLPVADLRVMGQCEHVICRRCLDEAPRIATSRGVLGCPQRQCYLLDEAGLCPDRTRRLAQIRRVYALPPSRPERPRTPDKSTESTTSFEPVRRPETPRARRLARSVAHLVNVSMVVFREGRDLHQQFFTLPSDISIGTAFLSCLSDVPGFERLNLRGRCFLGPVDFVSVLDRGSWTPVDPDSPEPLYKLEDEDMRLVLVVDLVGVPR